MPQLILVLTLWQYGHMTEDEVIDWAWKQVEMEEVPSFDLLQLAEDGPQKCLTRDERDFAPRPIELNYVEQFSLQVAKTQLESDDSVLELVRWAAATVIGEDINEGIVQLGYRWDHLINDCANTESAVTLARAEIPKFMSRCENVAAKFALSGA